MDKAIKRKYKADFVALRELMNSFDPCGLISGGAPVDEYDCLTQQLLSSVYSNKTKEEVKAILLHEVVHHFGTPDVATLAEPYKTRFNSNLDKFLNDLDTKFLTR